MLRIPVLFVLLVISLQAQAAKLYIKAYGNPKSVPVLFLHGGPGYNSANFEVTTARRLAEKGFYVVVYDRRGEGRSTFKKVKYTFEEAFNDINYVLKKKKIKSVILLGHSFGGMLALKYAEKFPENVRKIVLMSAPVQIQATFRNIITQCKTIYADKYDTLSFGLMSRLEDMDTASLEYASYCFQHAMFNGLYRPKDRASEGEALIEELKVNPLFKISTQMTTSAVTGYYENEKYTTLDLRENLRKLVNSGMKVYGFYGKEDGLFSDKMVKQISSIIGRERLLYLDICSHNVFIDQQWEFVKALKEWCITTR